MMASCRWPTYRLRGSRGAYVLGICATEQEETGMLRIAVVGTGGYGRMLRPNILSAVDHGMCQLVAVADNRLTELRDQAVYLQPYGPEL